jgi:hypothetical protein
MRKAWHVLGGFVVGAAVTAAFSHRHAAERAASSQHVTLAERELDRIVERIDLDAVPFDRAAQDVRKLTRARIDVDDAALASVDFDRKCRITLHGLDISLGEILERLTAHNSGGAELGYEIAGGRILITAAGSGRTVRYYDVADLVARSSMLDDCMPARFALATPLKTASS